LAPPWQLLYGAAIHATAPDTAPERRLTFRQCLSHITHLPAVEPLCTYGQDPATLRAFIPQRARPAGPVVYSDINFILLSITIE
jgi:CubicO group peptidase (beta-lactamase class C family)